MNNSGLLIGQTSLQQSNFVSFDENGNLSSFGPLVPMLVEAGAKIVETLPQLGIGRRARTKEAQAYSDIKTKEAQTLADINNQSYKSQIESDELRTKQIAKIALVAGSMLLVVVVVIIVFRNK